MSCQNEAKDFNNAKAIVNIDMAFMPNRKILARSAVAHNKKIHSDVKQSGANLTAVLFLGPFLCLNV